MWRDVATRLDACVQYVWVERPWHERRALRAVRCGALLRPDKHRMSMCRGTGRVRPVLARPTAREGPVPVMVPMPRPSRVSIMTHLWM